MSDMIFELKTPLDVMKELSQKVKALRLEQNITQQELADKVGIAIGTVKRFEKTGEIQLKYLLQIALVLGRLNEFSNLFSADDIPISLYNMKEKKTKQRARKK